MGSSGASSRTTTHNSTKVGGEVQSERASGGKEGPGSNRIQGEGGHDGDKGRSCSHGAASCRDRPPSPAGTSCPRRLRLHTAATRCPLTGPFGRSPHATSSSARTQERREIR
ncbi:unnamed protein product [Urochloa humidicola]